MITASNIYIKYGDRILFNHLNFVIKPKIKMGLVGRNGAGKSTLLKIIAKEISPDAGEVSRSGSTTLGYLKQEISLDKDKKVMDEALGAFEQAINLKNKIDRINEEISIRTDYESAAYEKLLNELSEFNDQFQLLGGYTMEAETEKVLIGLGFKSPDLYRKIGEFSGGWQMRIELAKLLLTRPDFLLLDEPTNHLDIESIIWLEQYLRDYEGAVVVISHDKMFLDQVTKFTAEIEFGRLYEYKANYSKYLEMRLERREQQEAAFKNQQKQIAETEKLIDKFRAKASKAKMAQSLIKQLDRMDKIEIDQENNSSMRISFPPAPRSGQVVVDAKKVIKQYGDAEILSGVDFTVNRGERVAFVGQNGQGKTTFTRILINNLDKTSGTVTLGHNVQIGYYAQNQSDELDLSKTVLEIVEGAAPPDLIPKVRRILGSFMFSGEDAEKKASVLSGGERARVALACLLLRPINLLVLDEPTNHLDILSKEVLKDALMKYDGTLLIVSHDREFLQGLTSKVVEFKDKKLFDYLGDITYFLEKRKADNMREISLSGHASESNKSKQKNQSVKLSYEAQKEKRKLEKAVKNSERKIEKAEKEIAEIELKMADPSFYQSSDADKIMAEYKTLKNSMDDIMSAWEKAQENLDAFESKH